MALSLAFSLIYFLILLIKLLFGMAITNPYRAR